ncbi:unnamed protein product [Mycena citricolor]|uniref:Cytochrome P450 n=2 Tax=Mycena citricolor TaxID=2018698 RepID=A0AAD2HHU3_9AGAR|nr:unnamed protein product [Mycena citricolor]
MRSALPRSYTTLVPELVDEAQHVVPYAFDTDTNYPLWESVVHLVARVANRAIIGVPGCRDEAFLALQVAVAEQAIPVAQVLRWFPVVCRPFVWSVFSALAGSRESCLAKLMPYVQQRVVDSGKEDPATVLDLLLKHAPESELSDLRTLALRVTHLNMAAIHTSSIFLTHSLFEIARLPAPQLALLRQEMDDAVAAEGGICSKAALSNFHLLDSLLKEVGRYHMQVSVGSSRMVMQPITLSDGTLLPAGCAVSLAHEPIHFDTKTYPDPYTFKPFRFAHLRTADGDTTSNVKHTFTHLANEYIVFGTGPRACPGRFFASLTIKILVYEILREFDLAFPDGASTQPQPFAFNGFILPNQKATLRFVKRDMK